MGETIWKDRETQGERDKKMKEKFISSHVRFFLACRVHPSLLFPLLQTPAEHVMVDIFIKFRPIYVCV
jgi:hypothetical protein